MLQMQWQSGEVIQASTSREVRCNMRDGGTWSSLKNKILMHAILWINPRKTSQFSQRIYLFTEITTVRIRGQKKEQWLQARGMDSYLQNETASVDPLHSLVSKHWAIHTKAVKLASVWHGTRTTNPNCTTNPSLMVETGGSGRVRSCLQSERQT